jgi:hypothetical protein
VTAFCLRIATRRVRCRPLDAPGAGSLIDVAPAIADISAASRRLVHDVRSLKRRST